LRTSLIGVDYVALDATGVTVFPTSTSAVKRCALGALIAAAYELTHDHDAADLLAYEALRPHCGASWPSPPACGTSRGHRANGPKDAFFANQAVAKPLLNSIGGVIGGNADDDP
jgi:hypothetical protein